jgi:hypothetical protein
MKKNALHRKTLTCFRVGYENNALAIQKIGGEPSKIGLRSGKIGHIHSTIKQTFTNSLKKILQWKKKKTLKHSRVGC